MENITSTNDLNSVPAKKKGGSFRGFLIKFILIALLVGAGLIYWFFYNTFSDGERTGLLTKLSHKGNVMKTYEGEMMIGNITQTATGLANEKFLFSVADDAVADTLMKLQGQRITVQYKQYRKTLPWRGDSEYMIVGFQRIGQ